MVEIIIRHFVHHLGDCNSTIQRLNMYKIPQKMSNLLQKYTSPTPVTNNMYIA